jgi:hypothetical protein
VSADAIRPPSSREPGAAEHLAVASGKRKTVRLVDVARSFLPARGTRHNFDFSSTAFFLPEAAASQAGKFVHRDARPLPTSSSFMAHSFR